MARRRSRLIAAAIVLCAGASIAYGDFTVTTSPITPAGIGSVGTQMRTVFSIRNTAAAPRRHDRRSDRECTGSRSRINGTTSAQWAFAARARPVVQASYLSAGVRTCPWNVAAPGVMSAQFTTSFDVDPANQMGLTAQPVAFDFMTTSTSETQLGYLQNYAQSALAHTGVYAAQSDSLETASGASTDVSTLAFGDVKVATTSAPQTVTIQPLDSPNRRRQSGHRTPRLLVDACDATPCTIDRVGARYSGSLRAAHPHNRPTLDVVVGG